MAYSQLSLYQRLAGTELTDLERRGLERWRMLDSKLRSYRQCFEVEDSSLLAMETRY
jgi:hypothetical protein